MKTIGIFDAKTHLPRICDEVQRSGAPLLIQRRGKPVAIIAPVPAELAQRRGSGIIGDLAAWDVAHPVFEEDFPEVWTMRRNRASSAEATGEK